MNRTTKMMLVAAVACAAALWGSTSMFRTTGATQANASATRPGAGRGAPGSATSALRNGEHRAFGTRLDYFAETSHEISLGQADTASSTIIAVEGSLSVTTVGSAPDSGGTYLRFQLADPAIAIGSGTAVLDGQAQTADQQLREALHQRFYGLRAPDGHVAALYFFPDRGHHAEGFLRTLVGASQFVRSDESATAWSTREQDAVGEYVARYEQHDGDTYRRSKESYDRIAGERGLVAAASVGEIALESETQFRFRADSLLESVSLEEQLTIVPTASIASRDRSQTHLTLTGTGFDPAAVAQWNRDRGSLSASELARLPEPSSANDDRYRDILGGASWADLSRALQALDFEAGDDGRALMGQLVALFVLQPATAAQAIELIRTEKAGERTSLLLGALASADTAETQAAVTTIMADDGVQPAARVVATGLIGFSDEPTTQTVTALRDMAERDVDGVSDTAVLALGNAARRVDDDVREDALIDYLLEGFTAATNAEQRRLYLDALGNAGAPRSLGAIVDVLGSADAAMRREAVLALALIPTPEADEIVARVMHTDPHPMVRRAAVESATYRDFAVMLPALSTTLANDPDSSVRFAAVNAIGANVQINALALAAVSAAAENDADDAVRTQAAQYLR